MTFLPLLFCWFGFFPFFVSLSPSLQHQHWAMEAPFYMPALDIKSVRISGMQCNLIFFYSEMKFNSIKSPCFLLSTFSLYLECCKPMILLFWIGRLKENRFWFLTVNLVNPTGTHYSTQSPLHWTSHMPSTFLYSLQD